MRVLLADHGWKMRGGQWQTLYLADGLRERGHTVRVLARYGSMLWEICRRDKFDVRALGASTMLTQSGGFDVVNVQDSHSHTLAALFSRRPFLVSRRVVFPVKDSWTSRKKYAKAAGYLAVSNAAAKELHRAQVPPERIRVVHDGVPDVTPADYARHIVGLKSDDPGKMNLLMLESAKRAELEIHLGDSLADSLKSGLLFLYLSQSEGLGSAVLFAMAAGLPIIASRLGGLMEVVDEGFSGLLVPNDPQAVSMALRAVADDRSLVHRFGENARRRYLQMFTADRMVDNTVRAYQELLRV
jgi:hypothetical protein